ncbi:MAG: hypothetical protein KAG18_04375 [Sinobacterium sp.]|nr:hypothetical protein [Sinobacterium sp.]
MKNKLLLLSAILLITASSNALSWSFDRSNTWEGFFQLHYQLEEKIEGKDNSYFKQSDDIGWGFGFGYNFTRKLSSNFTFTNTRANYRINFGDRASAKEYRGTSDFYGFQLNGQIAFFDTEFTPIAQLGLGSATWDSNKVSSYSGGYCYVPWPPYSAPCGYYNTYKSSGLTYNAGIGARWDYSRTGFLKLLYVREYADLDFHNNPEFESIALQFGGKF